MAGIPSLADKKIKVLSGSTLLAGVKGLAWVLFLVFLPVTNFPYFPPDFGGDSIVRPLSLFPLVILLLVVTIPHLLRKPVPRTLQNLLPFVIVAAASSIFSLLRGINSTYGVSVAQRLIRALLTLGIGCGIYMTVALIPKSFDDLRATLRWIYTGFGIALLWGSFQAFYIVHFSPAYYYRISQLQKFIATRRLFENRISGLTYEPNWFAEQICFLLIPWLLAAVMNDYTVFRWRWRRVTIEWFLLIWAGIVLAFTFSRAGLLVLFVLSFASVLFFKPKRKPTVIKKTATGWSRRLLEASLVLAAVIGVVFLAGSRNDFFSRLWNYWDNKSRTTLAGYLDYLGFGARFAYGSTALRIYETNPWLGVGLGNYAFYFEDNLPERLLAEIPEILRLLTQNAERYRLMTPKNLYLRILAETGLAGMATFLIFILAVVGCALYLYLAHDREQKYWGTAGLYAMIVFSLAAMSYDSFAIPNMWVVFGLITAAAWIGKSSARVPQAERTPWRAD